MQKKKNRLLNLITNKGCNLFVGFVANELVKNKIIKKILASQVCNNIYGMHKFADHDTVIKYFLFKKWHKRAVSIRLTILESSDFASFSSSSSFFEKVEY